MNFCSLPPTGWWCSREEGHSGPCAARQTSEPLLKTPLFETLDEATQLLREFQIRLDYEVMTPHELTLYRRANNCCANLARYGRPRE